jgi:hypothetical protein
MDLHLEGRIEVVIGERKIDFDESKSAPRHQGCFCAAAIGFESEPTRNRSKLSLSAVFPRLKNFVSED